MKSKVSLECEWSPPTMIMSKFRVFHHWLLTWHRYSDPVLQIAINKLVNLKILIHDRGVTEGTRKVTRQMPR